MRRARAIGLSAFLAVSACGGGGDGGGGAAPAPLEEPRASEAVGVAVVGVADALVALAGTPPLVELAGAPSGQTAGLVVAGHCEGGGHLSGTCTTRHSGSTLRTIARDCRLVDPTTGLRVAFDGRLIITTPAASCNDVKVPINALRTYRFEDFHAELRDDAGVVESFATARFVETVLPLRTGCDKADATLDLDGEVAMRRRDRVAATLRADGLRIERRTSGASGRCAQRLEASGGLQVDDTGGGRRTAVDLDGLAIQVDGDGAVRAVDGSLALACAPEVRISTDQPFLSAPGGCPRGGRLALDRPDGSRGMLLFAAGGLAVDADADGVAERVVADCRDATLAQCP